MDGQTRQITAFLVDRAVVRGIGTLALLGAVIFIFVGIPAISVYLALGGVIFWGFSLGWKRRYENVLEAPPEGYKPTGEVYVNIGGEGSVAVYFKGISRVYVRVP